MNEHISEIICAVVSIVVPFLSWLYVRKELRNSERLKNDASGIDNIDKIISLQTKNISESIEDDKKYKELFDVRLSSLMEEMEREREERKKEKEKTEKFRVKMSEDMGFLIRCYKSVLKSTCTIANCPLRKTSCENDMDENDREKLKNIL